MKNTAVPFSLKLPFYRRGFLLFFALIALQSSFSQDSLLIEALKKNTHHLNVKNDRFSGKGAEVVRKAMKGQQFLLVGEQHGIQEVGEFTKALFLEGNPRGFDYLCVETDPFIAQKLEALVKEDRTKLEAFCKEFPLAIPFYNNKEDFDFLYKAVKNSKGEGPILWGVDQVFAAAPRYMFARLAEIAPNKKAKELAEQYLEQGKKGFDAFLKTQDQSKSLISTLGEDDYKKLFAVFGKEEEKESTQILKGIQKTQEIYGYWFAGRQYDNNSVRVKLMKKQFMDYYRAAQQHTPHPKVVFKFGSTHTYKGLSYYDQLDLGNMIHELADMNGNSSLHISVMGLKGKAAGGFGGTQEFDNTKNINPLILEAVQARSNGTDWLLVDLKSMRHQFNKRQIAPLRDIAFNYDFLVIVPEAKALSTF